MITNASVLTTLFIMHIILHIMLGSSSVIAEMGLPQGSVLSPVLFNVYLEEALGSSELLKKVRSRGDLLAFADEMLIMSNER